MLTSNDNHRRGFTLIEILVVVIIMGIASAIIVPQLSTRDDLKLTSAARTLMSDLLYAQGRAVAYQKMHYVQFDVANGKYDLLDAISPNDLVQQPLTHAPYEVVLNSAVPGVQLSTVSFDGSTILAFDELGAPYSYSTSTHTLNPLVSGSVVMAAGKQKITVSVAPFSGEISIQQ